MTQELLIQITENEIVFYADNWIGLALAIWLTLGCVAVAMSIVERVLNWKLSRKKGGEG